ncbi:MAG: hypothetical protein IJK52_02720 [Oscillospiraceae bacterium]|nr:hypothetical protein [Oscillospiraceae bacterium]
MKGQLTRAAVCPLCGQTYSGHPALSRTDHRTLICPDCGSRQAMAAMGASPEEQEEIVNIIHAHTGRER